MSQNDLANLMAMLSCNPELKKQLDAILQNGSNPRDAFYNEARRRGMDPEQILRLLGKQ